MRSSLSAGLLLGGCCLVVAPASGASDEGGHTLVNLNGVDAPVAAYVHEGRIGRLYGRPFAHGASPEASAEAFIHANVGMFGLAPADLDNRIVQNVSYDRDGGDYRFTLVTYDQNKAGIPVFRGEFRLLVRNEAGHPLVWANPAVRDVGAFKPDPRVLDAGAAMGRAAAGAEVAGIDDFTEPRLVIWAGVETLHVAPTLAWEFVGASRDQVSEDVVKMLFVTDANTGAVLHAESQILHVDVEGSTDGLATQGLASGDCEPEFAEALPYMRVNIGGNTAFADADGNFVIPHGGNDPVTVESRVWGRYFRVFNQQGADAMLELDVVPPGPAEFLHNPANDNDQTRAEVNAYLHANVVRDFILSFNPEYPTISTDTEFTTNVNVSGSCNAFYNGEAINFFRAGGSCPNMAYSTIVHHEYGHHLVATGGSGQGQYGEGMSDVMGVLIGDDPGLAYGFFGNCETPLRNADNNIQYPCNGGAHDCGQLISGCVWDTRNALVVTEPDDYIDILSNLAVNAVLMHTGSTITPQITIDYLTLDDDDEDLFNGTPHYQEIASGFGAHNMDAPDLQLISFEFPDGRPDLVDPDGSTSMRVSVMGVTGDPEPGTAVMFWDDGDGVQEIGLQEVQPNEYLASFPAAECPTQFTYYFSAETTDGFEQFWPSGAPNERYAAASATGIDLSFEDDFEDDLGWSDRSDPNMQGEWERGVPAGGDDGPESDSDGSGQCFVTGLAADEDVDGSGFVTVMSPIMDASDPSAVLAFDYWFFSENAEDIMILDASSTGGNTFATVQIFRGPGAVGWRHVEMLVSDIQGIENNDRFRMRLRMHDNSPNSSVEGGLDAVVMRNGFTCGDVCPGDFDGSGDVSFEDLIQLLAAWGPCDEDCPEDLDGDEMVGFEDLVQLLANFGPCP